MAEHTFVNDLLAAIDRMDARAFAAFLTPDARFRFGTRTMHEIFASNPDVNHVMLRDHTGPLLARRIFQRETYYQHRFVAPVAITGVPMSSAAAQSSTLGGGRASIVAKDLGRLEDVARDNLQDLAVPLL